MSEPTCSICGLPGDFPGGKCNDCFLRQEALREQVDHEDDEGDEDDEDDDEDEDDEELQGYEGGECTRCGLALDEGYCPNDRCPFADTYQDEMIEDWTYPEDDEQAYIETLRGHAKESRHNKLTNSVGCGSTR
jgi:hypothetical protein